MKNIALCLIIAVFAHSNASAESIEHMSTVTGAISPVEASGRLDPAASSSTSLSFNLTYGADLQNNIAAQNAFNMAADRWSTVLKDPISVNLDLDFTSLGSGILGSTWTSLLQGGFDTVRDLVSANAGETNNAREASLLPNLPSSAQFSAYMPSNFGFNGTMLLSQASYHALGQTGFDDSDGTIKFSTDYSWDFDPTDGIDAGAFDFVGVAVHEIGHALGFISEVDYIDYVLSENASTSDVQPQTLDLFRFRTEDLGEDFDFTDTPRNLAPNTDDSLYLGDTSVQMSTGYFTGDGRQASHWKDNLSLGLMDPTMAPGELGILTEVDLIALDLIGWDIDWELIDSGWLDAQVPEPATMSLFAIGCAAIIASRKKSRP